MTEKIKLTQEQAEVLEDFLKGEGGDKSRVISVHATVYCNPDDSWVNKWKPLNDLSVADLARALLIGYEVEPRLEVGDWAVRKKSRRIIAKPTDCEGIAFQIEEMGIGVLGSDGNNHAIGALRHATPEEIAEGEERHLWKSLKRDVKEFKNGDVGLLRNGMITSHLQNLEDYSDDLVGFYPAESFVKFGGDE